MKFNLLHLALFAALTLQVLSSPLPNPEPREQGVSQSQHDSHPVHQTPHAAHKTASGVVGKLEHWKDFVETYLKKVMNGGGAFAEEVKHLGAKIKEHVHKNT